MLKITTNVCFIMLVKLNRKILSLKLKILIFFKRNQSSNNLNQNQIHPDMMTQNQMPNQHHHPNHQHHQPNNQIGQPKNR